ncbi:MAG: UDP-glucose--hexose-1-phosphate uridylyltransferase [Pyrinomonadaceae bacterium]|nr:UDP-glucose--hexose-1-phosphate uridylyltransferase [Pyrinomonadaceae bacterium]
MTEFQLTRHPHRRFNPLTGEWVLVSPQRTERPWQGQVEESQLDEQPTYDPDCYLCPGNVRAGGVRNPPYTGTFVFDNDFAALRPDIPEGRMQEGALVVAESERGICRVVCFSPRHDLTVARMRVPEIRQVVDTWVEQYQELGAHPFINWVQIFENRGAQMGASNPHPHCQIWAEEQAPNESRKEAQSQSEYHSAQGSCLLCDYLEVELRSQERLVCENDGFVALVPFWAVWPFEIMVMSKRHVTGLDDFSDTERTNLAGILKQVTSRYDNLFQVSFPYTMGFHQRPTDGKPHPEWHLHAHFYPPLLRSASIRKFMVGYELLATPQRDITAETAAQRLRDLGESD